VDLTLLTKDDIMRGQLRTYSMYSFKGNDSITVFEGEEMELIESINTAERKGSINLPLKRHREESNLSYFERLINHARSISNQ